MTIHLCVCETGGDWVPGGEGRRTGSGPGGSSPKAFPSGAQDHLVTIGLAGPFVFASGRSCRSLILPHML